MVQIKKIVFPLPGIQPCPYTVYRFYDFGDHDSEIMASSNSPEFNDGKVYPVPMTEELDKYLRTDVSFNKNNLYFTVTAFKV